LFAQEAEFCPAPERQLAGLRAILGSPQVGQVLVLRDGETVVGMVVLLSGLIAQVIPVGIVGFLVSLVGLVLFLSNLSFGKSEFKGPKGARTKWSSRLEDRWERRNFDN
jgi:hypothetical protein